jgi:hypothetical protein
MALTNLVPIRVKIKKGVVNGKVAHIYPDFNTLSSANRGNLDWSLFIDTSGTGWHYDKVCGFGEADAYNGDVDVWYGCLCVPSAFATEAISLFPDDVEQLSEADFETFYNDRAHAHEPEEIYNTPALEGIKVKQQLNVKLSDSDKDALNPDKPNPGINKNHNKTWALYKAKKNITIAT